MTSRLHFILALGLLAAACSRAPGQPGPSGTGGTGGGETGGRGGRGGAGGAGSGPTAGTGNTSTGAGGTAGGTGTAGAGGTGAGGALADGGSTIDAAADAGPAEDAGVEPDPAEDAGPAGDSGGDAAQMILPPAAPGGPDPIGAGWTEVFPSYKMDQPPGQVRYTLEGGEFHLWLLRTDQSTYPGRDSGPRSEIHIRNNYSSGQAQYQADIKIDSNCSGVSLMQVFGGSRTATGFMAFVTGDSLTHYSSETIVSPIRNRWFRLNVIHDTASANVDVYIDGQRRARYQDHGPATHYFKCGLYHQRNMTPRCDAWFKNIRVFKK